MCRGYPIRAVATVNGLVTYLFRFRALMMNEGARNLHEVLLDVGERLNQAARSRRAAMHTPVVGTADGDLRIMVLRACDPDLAQLRFHTDARSPKVSVMRDRPDIALLAYDPAEKVQIRARGTARVEQYGPVADAAWSAATTFARRCYLTTAAPGVQAAEPSSGLPEAIEGVNPTEAQLLPARENFAVVLVTLTELDWLHLAHDGHARAQFTRGDAGQPWQGTWVVP